MLPLYCHEKCGFSVFFCCYTAPPALFFSRFFLSQLVNCIPDKFALTKPIILITFPFFSYSVNLGKFPIAGASEQVVYCSLYYAFLMLKGCKATIVQVLSSM